MSWFFLALIPPILWSLSNHVDKALLSQSHTARSREVLVLVSALFQIAAVVAIPFFTPISISLGDSWPFILVGALGIVALIPYFAALDRGETSLVAPLYQVIPVLYLVASYVFLGETVTTLQLLGIVVIVCGALLLSWRPTKHIMRLDILGLMLLSMLAYLAAGITFKYFGVHVDFWSGFFYQSIGGVLCGIVLLALRPYRRALLFVRLQNRRFISLNAFNEALSIAGWMAMRAVGLMAPLAVVNAVTDGFQPIFLLMWSLIFTFIFPGFGIHERFTRTDIYHKFATLGILAIGTFLIIGA